MNLRSFLLPAALATLILGATSASADSPQADNTSSVNQRISPVGEILDRLYADYFGVYHGPVLDNLESSHSVNNQGHPSAGNPMYFDSELTTAYLIDQDSGIGIGPDIPFQAYPVNGQGLVIGDVGLKTFQKKTIDTGNFRLYTNLYVQAPTSQYSSQVTHMKYGLKTTPYWWYHFSGSRFTVGSWNEIKDYVGVLNGTAFKLYSEPYVSYRITPKLSANLGYEMEAHHMVGTSNLNFSSYETDLQPGIVWFINRKITVNPYFQLFTGNSISYDSTAIGAVITARLL